MGTSYGILKGMRRFFLFVPASLEKGDFSLFLQVFFVPDEKNDDGRTGQGSGIRQPIGQGIEALSRRDIIDE